MACSSAGQCAAKATGLFVWWMLGYLHGPGANQTTGLAYRNATMPGGTFLASKAVALGPNSSTAAVAHSYSLLLDWQWEPAFVEAQRAVALNESDANALAWMSKVFHYTLSLLVIFQDDR